MSYIKNYHYTRPNAGYVVAVPTAKEGFLEERIIIPKEIPNSNGGLEFPPNITVLGQVKELGSDGSVVKYHVTVIPARSVIGDNSSFPKYTYFLDDTFISDGVTIDDFSVLADGVSVVGSTIGGKCTAVGSVDVFDCDVGYDLSIRGKTVSKFRDCNFTGRIHNNTPSVNTETPQIAAEFNNCTLNGRNVLVGYRLENCQIGGALAIRDSEIYACVFTSLGFVEYSNCTFSGGGTLLEYANLKDCKVQTELTVSKGLNVRGTLSGGSGIIRTNVPIQFPVGGISDDVILETLEGISFNPNEVRRIPDSLNVVCPTNTETYIIGTTVGQRVKLQALVDRALLTILTHLMEGGDGE